MNQLLMSGGDSDLQSKAAGKGDSGRQSCPPTVIAGFGGAVHTSHTLIAPPTCQYNDEAVVADNGDDKLCSCQWRLEGQTCKCVDTELLAGRPRVLSQNYSESAEICKWHRQFHAHCFNLLSLHEGFNLT